MLAHNPEVKIAIEPKPNEPMDQAYVPTIGHAISLAYLSNDPDRVGGLIETAHALLAGLDPSDEMAFALFHKKLWSVHLNDQNGLKFDQDKSFGAANLRTAFNQVRVLEEGGYGRNGEMVGLDVKALRTTRQEHDTQHLANSKRFFEIMLHKVRTFDRQAEARMIQNRDYEGLERMIIEHLLGADEVDVQNDLHREGPGVACTSLFLCVFRRRSTDKYRLVGATRVNHSAFLLIDLCAVNVTQLPRGSPVFPALLRIRASHWQGEDQSSGSRLSGRCFF